MPPLTTQRSDRREVRVTLDLDDVVKINIGG